MEKEIQNGKWQTFPKAQYEEEVKWLVQREVARESCAVISVTAGKLRYLLLPVELWETYKKREFLIIPSLSTTGVPKLLFKLADQLN